VIPGWDAMGALPPPLFPPAAAPLDVAVWAGAAALLGVAAWRGTALAPGVATRVGAAVPLDVLPADRCAPVAFPVDCGLSDDRWVPLVLPVDGESPVVFPGDRGSVLPEGCGLPGIAESRGVRGLIVDVTAPRETVGAWREDAPEPTAVAVPKRLVLPVVGVSAWWRCPPEKTAPA
jgi:hypothetical protein